MPELAADITPEELDKEVRDELRSLPNDLANMIASHLVAAERALGDDDAALAYEHAKVARRFAARIGVVREAVGLAAYRAGHYAEALSDLRAARRMTGSEEFLPIMADCERGLRRPERALDLVRSPEAGRLGRAGQIELAIVESGARRDLGQFDAAVITLQRLPELRGEEPHPWSARLAFAYADALAEAGHESAATDWFERAMMFDEDGETDAAERYAQLTGAVIEDIEEDDEEDGADAEFLVDAGGVFDLDDQEDEDLDDEPSAGLAAESDADPVRDLHADTGDGTDVDVRDGGDAGLPGTGTGERDDASEERASGAPEDSPAAADAHRAAPLAGPATGGERVVPQDEGADSAAESAEIGTGDGDVQERQAPSATAAPRVEIGMAPPFIEPDFGVSAGALPGDVLDDDDEADDARRRASDRRDD
ncbi:hypothetical protein Sme01_28440 [Sphaerisporangium melleum]|uniref:TPR-repeat-containing protein n=1 Tax=Sphaerisporangium melleum TaxID=321316 RepID=A0A917VIS8_9ACTN|nr:tetratricopeptide repeat protein [Sphaerisporangium melleum]GGK84131.1 hypothetical protein GCM10007964_28210 [Sphaerisporangium melleum]GII70368.1 hypothetical protein Sme01_28440 [Sphaerisporangium melleum]